VPDSALPLVLVAAAFLLILGFRRTAGGLFAVALLLPVLGPFVEALIDALPPWVTLLIGVIVVLMLLQLLASVFIGRRAAAHMVGILAADVVRLVVLCLLLPFRWLLRACRALLMGGSR
jgi:uncharacterized membrane protein YozB (DUF420 family)